MVINYIDLEVGTKFIGFRSVQMKVIKVPSIFIYTCQLQVIAATNRADILDPALMRSGRLDRKIEFPHPTEEARARILQVWNPHTSSALFYLFF